MTAAEFALWADYYHRHGFDADRAEWATANAGAAVANAWGARVRASALVPKFGPRRTDVRRVRAWLEAAVANADRWFERGRARYGD